MKKHIYFLTSLIALLWLGGTLAHAQVKIGANPGIIGSSSNLEVEANNGNKTVVDKATGAVSITATADPLKLVGLQPATGSETALLIDGNGVVKKQGTTISIPTVRASGGTSANFDATSLGSLRKTPINTMSLNDGGFSTNTNSYTIATNGIYMISGVISFNYTTQNNTVAITAYVVVNNTSIKINDVGGASYANGPGKAVMSGSVTIPLNAGDILYLATQSCGPNSTACPQTYTITPDLTNLTITKML
ncbi:hypothetical protein [Rudanella lutea]|uniref:hypothetical protein n=1 Tax=Rudanella lutea TaxID=451374 RepID=UPI00037B2F82|nr:hypothetical protein [Rudanella lutea]